MKLAMNYLIFPCLLSQTVAISQNAPVAHQLQSAGAQLPTMKGAPEIPLPTLEPQKNGKGRKLMDAIHKFRAEICYEMKEEHGKEFASYEACLEFMEEACHPGKDHRMDGDGKEITSGEGYCEEYFKPPEKIEENEEDLKKQVHAGRTEPQHKVKAVSPVPAPAPAAEKKEAAPAPAAEKKEISAPAPAAAAAGGTPAASPGAASPGPAPVPGPYTPGLTGGKPWGAIPDDEAYYYKKNGKHNDRLHMNADLKLPTEGYWGKLVEHEDQKTATGDWGNEFGPGEDTQQYCKKHPENRWCCDHGYTCHRGSSPITTAYLMPLVCAMAIFRAI